ncbi:glycosyltransferase family 2 protein [Rufibacter tibetensis]|uniref:Family 2 glycosyl transferase n=1 Tax=Rufibacter tibetensis TaxID=512763 RepID=A0A0P0C8S3_9BACT|nr:glycosyltransferase [Rufibacter tibetensis]ALI99902.1 family 2 glycosyl transferase [Rufibacter tibetensis]
MSQILEKPPIINSLIHQHDRPLWSVMIPVYNCAHYLTETLESVLMQDLGESEMQIEVIDDASKDADVEEIVTRIGKGRIKYFRQKENIGSLKNFETCLNRSQGRLVHLLHGDDRVKPGFYQTMGNLFQQYPEAGASICRFHYIDETGKRLYDQHLEMEREGILEDWLVQVAVKNPSQYAATVVRREVYENLGGFYGITYGEDWEMWVRIAKHYPVAYTPKMLADYRLHSNSISGTKFLTGQNQKDIIKVMEMIQDHLPSHQKELVLKKSKKFYAHYGVSVANQVWHSIHHKQGVKTQIRLALRMHLDPMLLFTTAKVYIKMLLNIT